MIVAHHPYLLRLLQHVVNPLRGAIQYNVRLGRVFYLLQQRPENRKGRHRGYVTFYFIRFSADTRRFSLLSVFDRGFRSNPLLLSKDIFSFLLLLPPSLFPRSSRYYVIFET